jgi:hypothetical protein
MRSDISSEVSSSFTELSAKATMVAMCCDASGDRLLWVRERGSLKI